MALTLTPKTIVYKQLAQSRPSGTTIASIYSPPDKTVARIKNIYIANNTVLAATFQLCVDDDGTTYDESTALYWNVSLAANSTLLIDAEINMNNTSGNIAFESRNGFGPYCNAFWRGDAGLMPQTIYPPTSDVEETQIKEGSLGRLAVFDLSAEQLLNDILKELRKLNLQMELITDSHLDNQDI